MKNDRSRIQVIDAYFEFLSIQHLVSMQPFELNAGIYP